MEVDFSAKVQFTSFGPPIAKTCVFTGFLAAQKEKPVFFIAFCNFRNQKLQKAQVFTGFCAGRSHSVRAGSHGMPLGAVPCERARMECPLEPFRASGLAWNAPRSRSARAGSHGCPSEPFRASGLRFFGSPERKTCVFYCFLQFSKPKIAESTGFHRFLRRPEPFRASGLAWNAPRSRSVRAGSHGMPLGAVPRERARMECPSEPFRASGLAWMPLGAVPCERARMECSSGPFRASGLKWNVTLESKVNKLRCWNPGSSSWKVCSDFVAEASSERPISENNFYVWGPKIIF